MRVMITGASGVLGTELTNQLTAKHLYVTAVVRKKTGLLNENSFLTIITADLVEKEAVLTALNDVDVVIHCAAAMTGDYDFQYQNTVVTTQNLIESMSKSGVKRIILISSYSVYDYQAIHEYQTLTEQSKLKSIATTLGSYAKTKQMQEEIIQQSGLDFTVLRLGVIVPSSPLWISQLGLKSGKRLILLSKEGNIPLISLSNCVSAIQLTLENNITLGKIYNLVDDYLINRLTYAQRLTSKSDEKQTLFIIPFKLATGLIIMMQPLVFILRLLKRSVPQILNLESFYERSKPLNHTNQLFKQDTGWQPDNTLETL